MKEKAFDTESFRTLAASKRLPSSLMLDPAKFPMTTISTDKDIDTRESSETISGGAVLSRDLVPLAEELYKSLDLNGDNKVSTDEFRKVCDMIAYNAKSDQGISSSRDSSAEMREGDTLTKLFQSFDFICSTAKDGDIYEDDVPFLFDKDAVEELLQILDPNGDKEIDKTELLTGFAIIEETKGYKFAAVLITMLRSACDTYMKSARGVAQELFSKGISLGQLLDFVKEWCHEKKEISGQTKTYEVVQNIIIPQTAKEGTCMADFMKGGPKTPETLMSHWCVMLCTLFRVIL